MLFRSAKDDDEIAAEVLLPLLVGKAGGGWSASCPADAGPRPGLVDDQGEVQTRRKQRPPSLFDAQDIEALEGVEDLISVWVVSPEGGDGITEDGEGSLLHGATVPYGRGEGKGVILTGCSADVC